MTDIEYLKNNTVVTKFMDDLNEFLKNHCKTEFPNLYASDPERYNAKLTVGNRYLKIVVGDSTWGYISRVDGSLKGYGIKKGDLLMAAGKSPAKHSRGNIIDGTAKFGPYGPYYLK
jgi:hypothetical protein